MKLTFEVNTTEEAKVLTNRIFIAAEEAHDLGDDKEEEFFLNLWDQANKQIAE